MPNNPGLKDAKITISIPNESVDGMGSVLTNPAVVSQEWAEVRYLKGRELVESQQQYEETDTKFRVWASSNTKSLSSKHFIEYDGDVYDINGIVKLPGGRPSEVEIFAKRRGGTNG
jgi:SPP1 family predicted phage head-tail adaptor